MGAQLESLQSQVAALTSLQTQVAALTSLLSTLTLGSPLGGAPVGRPRVAPSGSGPADSLVASQHAAALGHADGALDGATASGASAPALAAPLAPPADVLHPVALALAPESPSGSSPAASLILFHGDAPESLDAAQVAASDSLLVDDALAAPTIAPLGPAASLMLFHGGAPESLDAAQAAASGSLLVDDAPAAPTIAPLGAAEDTAAPPSAMPAPRARAPHTRSRSMSRTGDDALVPIYMLRLAPDADDLARGLSPSRSAGTPTATPYSSFSRGPRTAVDTERQMVSTAALERSKAASIATLERARGAYPAITAALLFRIAGWSSPLPIPHELPPPVLENLAQAQLYQNIGMTVGIASAKAAAASGGHLGARLAALLSTPALFDREGARLVRDPAFPVHLHLLELLGGVVPLIAILTDITRRHHSPLGDGTGSHLLKLALEVRLLELGPGAHVRVVVTACC
jgi:hypothetical protein